MAFTEAKSDNLREEPEKNGSAPEISQSETIEKGSVDYKNELGEIGARRSRLNAVVLEKFGARLNGNGRPMLEEGDMSMVHDFANRGERVKNGGGDPGNLETLAMALIVREKELDEIQKAAEENLKKATIAERTKEVKEEVDGIMKDTALPESDKKPEEMTKDECEAEIKELDDRIKKMNEVVIKNFGADSYNKEEGDMSAVNDCKEGYGGWGKNAWQIVGPNRFKELATAIHPRMRELQKRKSDIEYRLMRMKEDDRKKVAAKGVDDILNSI